MKGILLVVQIVLVSAQRRSCPTLSCQIIKEEDKVETDELADAVDSVLDVAEDLGVSINNPFQSLAAR